MAPGGFIIGNAAVDDGELGAASIGLECDRNARLEAMRVLGHPRVLSCVRSIDRGEPSEVANETSRCGESWKFRTRLRPVQAEVEQAVDSQVHHHFLGAVPRAA